MELMGHGGHAKFRNKIGTIFCNAIFQEYTKECIASRNYWLEINIKEKTTCANANNLVI